MSVVKWDLEFHTNMIQNLVDGEVLSDLYPLFQDEQELNQALQNMSDPEEIAGLYEDLAACAAWAVMDHLFLNPDDPNDVTPAVRADEQGLAQKLAYHQIPHKVLSKNLMDVDGKLEEHQYIQIPENVLVVNVADNPNDDDVKLLFVAKRA